MKRLVCFSFWWIVVGSSAQLNAQTYFSNQATNQILNITEGSSFHR